MRRDGSSRCDEGAVALQGWTVWKSLRSRQSDAQPTVRGAGTLNWGSSVKGFSPYLPRTVGYAAQWRGHIWSRKDHFRHVVAASSQRQPQILRMLNDKQCLTHTLLLAWCRWKRNYVAFDQLDASPRRKVSPGSRQIAYYTPFIQKFLDVEQRSRQSYHSIIGWLSLLLIQATLVGQHYDSPVEITSRSVIHIASLHRGPRVQ